MSAGTYQGRLLDTLDGGDEFYTEVDEVPPCNAGNGWMHSSATLTALMAVCSGNVVTLTRRRRFSTFDEQTGSVTGLVIGGSSRPEGNVYLVFDDGTQVDVTNPNEWHWEVRFDGD